MKSESTNPQWADTPQWLPEKAGRWSLPSTIVVPPGACRRSPNYCDLVSKGTSRVMGNTHHYYRRDVLQPAGCCSTVGLRRAGHGAGNPVSFWEARAASGTQAIAQANCEFIRTQQHYQMSTKCRRIAYRTVAPSDRRRPRPHLARRKVARRGRGLANCRCALR